MKPLTTWKTIVALGGICIAVLYGCGSSDGTVLRARIIPDGYSAVSFTAGGSTGAAISHDLSVLLDTSDLGTGNASGVGGPTSIYDNVSVVCTFSVATTTTVEAIQITTLQGNCLNENECIVCATTGSQTSACSLSCSGTVPSSNAVAADSFVINLIYTSTIETDMSDPYGTVRYDADRTGTGFNLSTMTLSDSTGCSYNPGDHELGLVQIPTETWFTDIPGKFRRGMRINALDPNAGNANRSTCTMIHTVSSAPTMTGANTPGTAVEIDLGTVTFKSKICDYKDDVNVAHNLAACVE